MKEKSFYAGINYAFFLEIYGFLDTGLRQYDEGFDFMYKFVGSLQSLPRLFPVSFIYQ